MLSRQLDNGQGAKPFTVSPLYVERDWASFRITLLQDSLFDLLRDGIQKRPKVNVLGDDMPIAGELSVIATTYPLMAEAAAPATSIFFRFRTPVSFRRNEMDYPLPEPELVFESYRRRWNTFGPEALRIDDEWLSWLCKAVAVTRFELVTAPMRFPNGLQIGCIGQVQFEVTHQPSEDSVEARLNLSRLAEYAFYCGTGRKTTQGMGQTERLDQWEPKSGFHDVQ